MLDQAIVSGCNFLTTLVVVRMLSVDGFALYSLAFLTALFLSNLQRAFFTQPLNVLGATEAPPALFGRYLAILRLQWGAAALAAPVVACIGWFFYPRPLVIGATILYVAAFFAQEVVRRLHYTRHDIRAACVNDVLAYGLQLALLAALWAAGLHDPAWVFGAFAFTYSLAFVVGHLGLQRPVQTPTTSSVNLITEHWRYAKWIVLSQFVYWGSSQLYPFQLAHYVSHEAVANFATANSILNALNVLRLMLANYLPTRAAAIYASHGVGGLLAYLRRMLLLYGGLTVLMVVALVLASDWIIDTLFAGKYQGAKELLPYFAAGNAIIIVGVVINTGSLVTKVTDWIFYANAAGTAFSMLVGPLLLQRWGVWGAVAGFGIGTAIPATIQGAHLLWHCRRITRLTSIDIPTSNGANI